MTADAHPRPVGRPRAAEPRKTRTIRATEAEWTAMNEVGHADVRAWAVAEAARRRRRAESALQRANGEAPGPG